MSNTYPIERAMQLLALGYHITPNHGKACRVKGWNTPGYVKNVLGVGAERWTRRFPSHPTIGVRIDRGLAMLDIDVDDPLSAQLLDAIAKIAPDVHKYAPTRYGGGTYKVALIARTDAKPDETRKLRSHRYRRSIDDPTQHHCVEIFLSSADSDACKHQFGAYGAHTIGVRDYEWCEEILPLHMVAPQDLPLLTRAQALQILAAFEQLADEAGWIRLGTDAGANNAAFVLSIDDETRFELADGSEVNYAELCARYVPGDDLRCSSSFHGTGSNRSKCRVGEINALGGVIGVWDNEEDAWYAPKAVDTAALGQAIKETAIAQGWQIPQPVPNWRERYKGGHPKASFHNAKLAIVAIDLTCSADVFHNKMFAGRSSAASPREPLLKFIGEITDTSISLLRGYLSDQYGFDLTEKHVRDAVMNMAQENRFNPITDMLAEAEASWDGVERLDRMAVDYFNCADTPVNRACVRKTMIAAVARARHPGCKFDTILVLESPEGWNKSSVWLVLAGEGNFSDESILGKASREVQEHLAGIWIHENAELAGMKKADIDIVKSFASRTVDRARPAYGHFLVEQPRQSIEVGTTNANVYLQSQTGNRRFWPLKVLRPIDLAPLRKARLQLWGEAAHWESQGESLVLDEALWPVIGIEQEARRVSDPWEAKLAEMTRVPTTAALAGRGEYGNNVIHVASGEERVSTAVIFEHVLDMRAAQQEAWHARRLADVMRRLGWESGLFKFEGRPVRGYRRRAQ